MISNMHLAFNIYRHAVFFTQEMFIVTHLVELMRLFFINPYSLSQKVLIMFSHVSKFIARHSSGVWASYSSLYT